MYSKRPEKTSIDVPVTSILNLWYKWIFAALFPTIFIYYLILLFIIRITKELAASDFYILRQHQKDIL